MKNKLISILVLLLLAVGITAQEAPDVQLNLRRHVEYLASEKLEGRRTGEHGATAAAGYIANNFAKFKLRPGVSGGNSKGYLQQFPFISGVAMGKENMLRIVPADPTRENKMEVGINWMPLGYSPNAEIAPSEVVFAGYGITSAELKYDDYAGLDVKNKVVLIFDGTPEPDSPHSQFGRYNTHIKANIAKDKGALAMIIIAKEPDFKQDRLSRLTYDQTLGETAIPVAGLMRDHATELLGLESARMIDNFEEWLVARRLNAPANVQIKLPSLTGVRVGFKVNLEKQQTEAYNVIGILEGTDPVLKNEAIVIGAHYDHLGRGGQGSLAVNSSDIHHGADDNASGTAAVLELARQFAKERKNKRTLIFMAFGGEEEGLLGSKHYVNNPVWPLDKTVAMINLDMVGRLKDGKLNVGGIGTAAEWKPYVERPNESVLAPPIVMTRDHPQAGGRDLVIRTHFNLQLNEDGFGPSDHSTFYGKQIPVLFFFTGTHQDYHKPSDTFEKINYEGLTRITNYVGAITRSLHQNPLRPTYTQAKSSGVMGRSTGFNVSLGTVPSYADSTDGLVLDGVRENSSAAKAGIRPGDKIVKLAGKDVRNVMDYTYILGGMKAGQEYEVVLLRGTEKLVLKIVPAPAARR